MKNESQKRDTRLPTMTRGMQYFALTLFFLGGAALTAFVLLNPLGLPFLPEFGRSHGHAAESGETGEAQTLYQCPMHPEVIEDHPSDCPICGMPLVIMEQSLSSPDSETESPEATARDARVIEIDPVQVQNIGVVSHSAWVGEIARTAHTVGILDFDAGLVSWVNTKFSGWIEKAHVDYVGQAVRRGDPLFEIYSPDLVSTQEEYLRALDYRDSLRNSSRGEARRQAEDLLHSTAERLRYWDISADQIEELERNRTVHRVLTVRSPADGMVAEVMTEALEGVFVRPGVNLYKLVELSSLWAHADVYEADISWVTEGLLAHVAFPHDPERIVDGKVLFLYPEMSKETRTLKICVEVPNPGGKLRAGMYADVVLHGPVLRDAILIPYSSVLRSGERNLVFVDLGDGRFDPREVKLGVRGEGDVVQVLRGVDAGEAVVTQAQFMLDSESRVQEAISKFRERNLSGAGQ
jgi:Cu(I)/Ag(I) efflux system membrane fusion protein